MSISATIIADSMSPQSIRLTTMQLRYPRFIHAEFMTHRMFSRNASSSRAIPVHRLIEDIERDPAMPVFWGKNQPGMQAKEEVEAIELVKVIWIRSMEEAIASAEDMLQLGVHKQIANRLLEPFSHINVVVTATDYMNFYTLRRHADAQPEIKALADAMWEAQLDSVPNRLEPGEWHLPYVKKDEGVDIYGVPSHYVSVACSVARCARVSYLTHEGKPPNIEDDLKLYERLVGSEPLHASPAEHQATPDKKWLGGDQTWQNPNQHGNFRGWRQYRKMLPNEYVKA